MNVIVCVKQVLDPEAPPASFKVDETTQKVVPPPGVPPVISTFDEYAVEAALRLKEATNGKVTVLSLGANFNMDVVKKPLAMGADELILLQDEVLANGDSWSTAYALAMAIKKVGSYDVILCGRQAADWDSGQVGSAIAEILGLPGVTVARKVMANGGKATVERVLPDGYEVVETVLPAVITVSNEHDEPRYPNIKGIMAAKKKNAIIWKASDIGVSPEQAGEKGRRCKLVRLFRPKREGKCDVVGGNTPEEAVANLVSKLQQARVL